jgi:uncharacterized membrane protein
MNREIEQVRARLLQAGLIETGPSEPGELESPWYVKVLLAFSGWLAALFLLGFIGAGFEFLFRNSTAALIVGALMIGGAFIILRGPKNEFVEHLALALSLAGQALVVFVIFRVADHNPKIAWLLVVALETPLAVIMPNFVHRVFSSFAAVFAFNMILLLWGYPFLAGPVVLLLSGWCWLNEFRYPALMGGVRAIGFGLVLALVLLKGSALFSYRLGWQAASKPQELWLRPWVGEALSGAVALYVVWRLLQRYGRKPADKISMVALSGAFLLGLASCEVRGLTAGLTILLLGFAGANRVLTGLGIVALLFFISSYYYLLSSTLLVKSASLLLVGLALLILRWLLRFVPVQQEVEHV